MEAAKSSSDSDEQREGGQASYGKVRAQLALSALAHHQSSTDMVCKLCEQVRAAIRSGGNAGNAAAGDAASAVLMEREGGEAGTTSIEASVGNLTCSDIVQAATRSQIQNTTCQNGEISIELCVEQDAAGFLRWLWQEHVLSRVDFGGSKPPLFFVCFITGC
eukprot:696815-Rhodomonas_salina.1